MLTKFLITLAVILGTIWFSKRKAKAPEAELPELPATKMLNRLAPIFGVLLMLCALAWFGFDWYRGQQVMSVTVTAADGAVSSYDVRRADLDGRRLVTVDGLAVQLSQLDRIEVSPK